jgi:hypothetical protein
MYSGSEVAIARKRLALISGTGTNCFYTVKFWDTTLLLPSVYLAKTCRNTNLGRKRIKVQLKIKVL